MCLIPTVTKYRLGCSFEDSTIYPSPAQPPPQPQPQPQPSDLSDISLSIVSGHLRITP